MSLQYLQASGFLNIYCSFLLSLHRHGKYLRSYRALQVFNGVIGQIDEMAVDIELEVGVLLSVLICRTHFRRHRDRFDYRMLQQSFIIQRKCTGVLEDPNQACPKGN